MAETRYELSAFESKVCMLTTSLKVLIIAVDQLSVKSRGYMLLVFTASLEIGILRDPVACESRRISETS